MIKKISILSIILLTLYIGFCIFLFFYQENLLFFPSKDLSAIPEGLPIEEASFLTQDHITLSGWYLDNHSEKTVLFFHGNGGNISYLKNQLQVFNQLELNALVFDYRGYGKSQGNVTKEEDLYTDSQAALDYLVKEKNTPLEKIVLWGHSLGGALAIEMAQNKKFFATIIESSFISMDTLAKNQYWFLPTKLLLKYHLDNENKIKNVHSPILLIHSKGDEIIPFINGETLYSEANNPKIFLEISGSHNYGSQQSIHLYIETLQKFLNISVKSP